MVISFSAYIYNVIGKLKQDNRCKTASILRTAVRSFERFICSQDDCVPGIGDINNDLIRRYEMYLKNSGVRRNTSSCYMRALRTVYNQAVRQGMTAQKYPFTGVYMGMDRTVKRAVHKDIIFRLKYLDLSGYSHLALARDMFMASFYMRGMSFVDMANLRCGNVVSGYIEYRRSKTGRLMTVKIEPCISEIIERYKMLAIEDRLLPLMTYGNRNPSSLLRTYNKRLYRISLMMGLERPLSSYVARHTWATMALRHGIPVEVISESLGHDSESTTRIYLASLEQSAVDKANADIIDF